MVNINEYTENEKRRLQLEHYQKNVKSIDINAKQLASKASSNKATFSDFQASYDFMRDIGEDLDDEEYEKLVNEAWEHASLQFGLLNTPVYFANICIGLMNLARNAFMLMIENLKPKPKAPIPKQPGERLFGKTDDKIYENDKSFSGKKQKANERKIERVKGSHYDEEFIKNQGREAKAKESIGEKQAKEARNSETRATGMFSASRGGGFVSASWGDDSGPSWGGGSDWGSSPKFEPPEMTFGM